MRSITTTSSTTAVGGTASAKAEEAAAGEVEACTPELVASDGSCCGLVFGERVAMRRKASSLACKEEVRLFLDFLWESGESWTGTK